MSASTQVAQFAARRDSTASAGMGAATTLRLQRKCACGGGAGLDGECAECRKKRLQRHADGGQTPGHVPASVYDVLRAPGQPLEAGARTFMERRLTAFRPSALAAAAGRPVQERLAVGRAGDVYEQEAERASHAVLSAAEECGSGCFDFSQVRVHADAAAARSAAEVGALAYTVGNHIAFGEGRYSPESEGGRRLLAHELTHVVQQSGGAAAGTVQRAPTISVVDQNFVGTLTSSQRRAAASCPISCCDWSLGTLHAMPLFHHQSRSAQVAAGSAAATGIGAALHFIAASTQPPAGDRCHCDDFRIIQVLETTDPAPGRGGNSYVDNNGQNTPFYSDVFLGGRGEHAVPAGYPDAGERLTTTESIYDRPYRATAGLPASDLSWMAESCVSCIKNGAPDRILGCVSYGFTRHFNPTTHSFDPVVGVGPSCLGGPTKHFTDTLSSDPTTSSYDFKGPPDFIECAIKGDFPAPRSDIRYA